MKHRFKNMITTHDVDMLFNGVKDLKSFGKNLEQLSLTKAPMHRDKFKGEAFEALVEVLIDCSEFSRHIDIVNYLPWEKTNNGDDYGIDGIGKAHDGSVHTVQVKYRADHSSILKTDDKISNFVANSTTGYFGEKIKMTIITTAAAVDRNILKHMYNEKVRVIGFQELSTYISHNFWKHFKDELSSEVQSIATHTFRDTNRANMYFTLVKRLCQTNAFEGHVIYTPAQLIDLMLSSISQIERKSTFLVLFNVEFVGALVYNYGINAKQITFYSDSETKTKLVQNFGVNIIESLEDINMKFDAVLGNPPYQGQAGLHQQFFNKGVDLLNDNGTIVFVQPATPYFSKKDRKKKAEQLMIDNIKKYKTNVKFVSGNIFDGASIANDLAITNLTKQVDNAGIESITYANSTMYNNVDVENVNMMKIDPKIYSSISQKYNTFIINNNSMYDVLTTDTSTIKAALPKIRGHLGEDDFYTFIPKNDNRSSTVCENYYFDFGIKVNDISQVGNVFNYLESYVARFGLSMLKFNVNNDKSVFAMVPLVDFTRTYTDQELYDMIGLTDDEVNVIKSVISNYYDR